MKKDKIVLFIDGKEETFERDLAKKPLNLTDYTNAGYLTYASANFNKKEEIKPKDVDKYMEVNIKFIVAYFQNQFTYDQCKNGLNPAFMNVLLPKLLEKAQGVVGGEESPKK